MSRRVTPDGVSTGSATWKHSSSGRVGVGAGLVVAVVSAPNARLLYFAKGWIAPDSFASRCAKAIPAKRFNTNPLLIFRLKMPLANVQGSLFNRPQERY
jgi:hypothetical protein